MWILEHEGDLFGGMSQMLVDMEHDLTCDYRKAEVVEARQPIADRQSIVKR